MDAKKIFLIIGLITPVLGQNIVDGLLLESPRGSLRLTKQDKITEIGSGSWIVLAGKDRNNILARGLYQSIDRDSIFLVEGETGDVVAISIVDVVAVYDGHARHVKDYVKKGANMGKKPGIIVGAAFGLTLGIGGMGDSSPHLVAMIPGTLIITPFAAYLGMYLGMYYGVLVGGGIGIYQHFTAHMYRIGQDEWQILLPGDLTSI